MSAEQKQTNCHFCGYLCAFTATVEEGRITALEPDPTRYPYDSSILAGCQRWKMNLDVLDGADRVNHPLHRVGDRGAGEWERLSWDEALDGIASELERLRRENNAGVLASMIGGPHTSFWPLHRFMSLFGSPNNMGIGQICWNPRIWMDAVAFGWTIEADITDATKCLLIWGTNPAESDNSAFWRALLKRSHDSQNKIVVIDPRYTKTARIADLWIPIKPGTDCDFMLSVINVIIQEELYDKEFVKKWCYGFDDLVEHVSSYDPERIAQICGIEAEDIKTFARWFADGPSSLVSGRGIDQIGQNVAPTHRARCILLAITGNIDRPGSTVILDTSDFVTELELEMTDQMHSQLAALSLNAPHTPLQSYEGLACVTAHTDRLQKKLPARYLTSAHPDLVLTAMETGNPYPIRALIVEATNPLLTYADTHRVYRALMGLDLIVVLDYYMTPTAAIADYVLPAAGAMERATFQAHGGVANMVYGGARACDPYYERRADYEVFRELGLRLGQQAYWPDETFEDACARALAPTGLAWEDYCALGGYQQPPRFYKYDEEDASGQPCGFGTETGLIQLASPLLNKMGSGLYPSSGVSRQLCSDELIARLESEGFTHIQMITGGRKQPYNASMYLNNPSFRQRYHAPVVEMSDTTAEELGVSSGDTVILATDQGQARFKVATIRMRDGLIHADYGWWHPEWEPFDQRHGGIFDSNVNTLTSCSLDQAEPMIGTWSYNDLDCMIARSDEELPWPEKI